VERLFYAMQQLDAHETVESEVVLKAAVERHLETV
jgi:hypothetical protein